MKNLFTLIFLFLFLCSGAFGQTTFDSSSDCEKLSNHPDLAFDEKYEFAVFTGTETEGIDLVELVYSYRNDYNYGEPMMTKKWIKKKADRNCLSANPEDCLVWCLVEKPGPKEEILIVIDTTQTDQYRKRIFSREKIHEMKGFFEKREIPCRLPGKRLSRKICSALQEKGYLVENECKMRKFTGDLEEFFIDFQIDNNLFLGGLSLETLDLLGVEY